MSAGVYNLEIEQGSTCRRTIQLTQGTPATAVNLTGYTARAQVRATADSAAVLGEFTCSITPLTGTVVIELTDEQTAAIPVTGGQRFNQRAAYSWDLVLTDSAGVATRVLNGSAMVSPGVTR
jgi:hypothetical protein